MDEIQYEIQRLSEERQRCYELLRSGKWINKALRSRLTTDERIDTVELISSINSALSSVWHAHRSDLAAVAPRVSLPTDRLRESWFVDFVDLMYPNRNVQSEGDLAVGMVDMPGLWQETARDIERERVARAVA